MTGRTPWRPPLAALLGLLLRAEERDRALADLAEAHASATERRGRHAADRACRTEALAIVCWSIADRLRRLFERSSLPLPPRSREPAMLGTVAADLRFGLRSLRRRPAFSLLVVAVMALGIGANVAIFTLINRLFLQPPPLVESPGELVRVFRSSPAGYGSALGYPDYADLREGGREVVDLIASSGARPLPGTAGGARAQLDVGIVSDNYFPVLGIRPALGRFFTEDENRAPGTHPVAAISWRVWQDYFGGSDDVLGKSLVLNGNPLTVVGVVPRGFRGVTAGEDGNDVYVPVMMSGTLFSRSDEGWLIRHPDFGVNWLQVIGRLRQDVPVERAQAALLSVAERVSSVEDIAAGRSVYVTTRYRWYPTTYDELRNLSRLMMLAVTGLLAVAAVNVAVLFLARASARTREIGILSALGAARSRVVRQFLGESVILALVGGILGVWLAVGVARVAAGLLPVRLDPPPTPDWRVYAFAVGVALATAVVVGVIPGLRAASPDVVGQIQGRERTGGGRLRDGLIVAQVALSLVLVAGAALFARSLTAARNVDPGFDTHNTLLVPMDLSTRDYDGDRARSFMRDATARVRQLPGVSTVATVATVPFRGQWSTEIGAWPGAILSDTARLVVGENSISSGYLDAVRIPLVAGRAFDDRDRPGSEGVVIVNEALARAAFGTTDVVGRTIPLRGKEEPPLRIVGVARDATYYEFAEPPHPLAYYPDRQRTRLYFTLVIKTAGDPTALTKPATDVILGLDAELPIGTIETLDGVYREQFARYRASANVVGLTGVIALILAAVGLYGVMAFRVAQRTRDIGVRMALGATRRRVAREVVGRGLRLTLAGTALGLVGAFLLGRFVQGLVFGVEPRDPASLVVAPLVLTAVALVAVVVPARRAMRVDPMTAIRAE